MSSPDSNLPKPAWQAQALGVLLFLFIPVVLYLFVQHPEPIGWSLGIGVGLMLGHRFLARPYMVWIAPRKCLWSNEILTAREGTSLEIHHRGGRQSARCRERHRWHLERFFTFAYRFRWILGFGIFAPLLLLLGSLAWVAAGRQPPLPLDTARAIFQLTIGLTVNLAAWGYLTVGRTHDPLQIRFPVHNFFLLGVSNLLWIFRLVGVFWIYRGLTFLFFAAE